MGWIVWRFAPPWLLLHADHRIVCYTCLRFAANVGDDSCPDPIAQCRGLRHARPSRSAVCDPSVSFLHNSARWACGRRRILNCRRMLRDDNDALTDPCAVVERALRLSFALNIGGGEEEGSESFGVGGGAGGGAKLVEFLDASSAVSRVSMLGLSDAARLAFCLNVSPLFDWHAIIATSHNHTFLPRCPHLVPLRRHSSIT